MAWWTVRTATAAAIHCATQTDYTAYQRQPGTGFTAVPDAIPLPVEQCSETEPLVLSGLSAACQIPAGHCAIIESGSTVMCQDDLSIHGTLWMQSNDVSQKTLLIADNITVYGSLFVSAADGEDAQKMLLRHSYCGLPD